MIEHVHVYRHCWAGCVQRACLGSSASMGHMRACKTREEGIGDVCFVMTLALVLCGAHLQHVARTRPGQPDWDCRKAYRHKKQQQGSLQAWLLTA